MSVGMLSGSVTPWRECETWVSLFWKVQWLAHSESQNSVEFKRHLCNGVIQWFSLRCPNSRRQPAVQLHFGRFRGKFSWSWVPALEPLRERSYTLTQRHTLGFWQSKVLQHAGHRPHNIGTATWPIHSHPAGRGSVSVGDTCTEHRSVLPPIAVSLKLQYRDTPLNVASPEFTDQTTKSK